MSINFVYGCICFDWTITLDGTTNKMFVVANIEGVTDTLATFTTEGYIADAVMPVQNLESEYGKGTNINTFNGLDSISFISYQDTTRVAPAGTIYVDDVSVEVKSDKAKVTAALLVKNEEASTAMAGDVVLPMFTVEPALPDTYQAITAMYVNGKLTDMKIEEIKTETSATTTIAGSKTYTVPPAGDVVIKAFVWDNLETLEPISNTATVTAEDNSFTVYVSAYDGDDENGTGDANSPVATVNKAITVASNIVDARPEFGGAIRIMLDDGTYPVTNPIEVADYKVKIPAGGIYFTKAEGATPIITGGIEYDIKDAVKVEADDPILERLSSQAAKDNLYVLDLGDVEIPGQSWPGEVSFGVEEFVEAKTGVQIPDQTCEVSFDHKLMNVARWPNADYESGGTATGNLAEATEANFETGFTLNCTNPNLAKWATADQALVFGYFKHDWAVQTTPLLSAGNGTITTEYASRFGVDNYSRYYVFNLLEEIDQPGEYFIERQGDNAGKMYFYMPAEKTDNSKITLTLKKTDHALFRITETDKKVTVDGLTFESTLGSAIAIWDSENSVIKNCEIRNTAGSAIALYGKNCTIDNNYIHDTNGGITISASTNTATDVNRYLRAQNNVISNNHIENYSRIDKVYVDAINCGSVGNTVRNNVIHNGEHLAIRVSGRNNTIQYNEIYDVCKEVEDAGAIYVGKTWINRGNKILNNYIHDIRTNINIEEEGAGRSSVAGIFVDDHYAGAHIEGNVFADIYGNPLFIKLLSRFFMSAAVMSPTTLSPSMGYT